MDFFRSHLMPRVLPSPGFDSSTHLRTLSRSFLKATPWMTMPCCGEVLSDLVAGLEAVLGRGLRGGNCSVFATGFLGGVACVSAEEVEAIFSACRLVVFSTHREPGRMADSLCVSCLLSWVL
ncbi:hypothetical protein BDZ91DRAFT_735461 [Kalaharituber pfeilii]|nr:hypothetical protein BDZ91DRAFT_735461 [Kalaharituber pfeilii]